MLMTITAANLVCFITKLKRDVQYPYINESTKGLIVIDSITQPQGPIIIRRFDPSKGETLADARPASISTEMLWRYANAIRENIPFNIDRILGASYNTRSVLESLLAHTPQFYFCYPGRIERICDRETIEHGHKHLVWCPKQPHTNGLLFEQKVDVVISEIPNSEIVYEAISIPDIDGKKGLDIDIKRRHAQIQIALFQIGAQLNYRTWIAQNDKGILYHDKRICEYPGIVQNLREEKLLQAYDEAARAALLIDCIWFKNGKLMPAVMEVEESTGVTSGLTRMKKFKDHFPPFPTRWVIVAPDEDRTSVFEKCQAEVFKDMNPLFFPYSAVEELYGLCSRRKIKGITEDFLDCFMERTIPT